MKPFVMRLRHHPIVTVNFRTWNPAASHAVRAWEVVEPTSWGTRHSLGPNVGVGVSEVLSEEDSWLVADSEDPQAYATALRQIISDPAAARRRSRALRERLELDRPQRAYGENAADLLLDRAHRAKGAR